MTKELLWSEESDFVYGLYREFKSKEDFADEVKKNYESEIGFCKVKNILVQPCAYSEKGIPAGHLVPMHTQDIVVENYYTAEIVLVEE